ncbi:MAG: cytoskeletal protein CcmA (bactofilin family) [Halieaceae bacterium]|jgi:cytoskeletal protein CcmA (bactofilin family)
MLGIKSRSGSTTIISRDTVVVGDLHFNGSLDIEGLVQGNIIALPGKDAILRVIERGRVEGEIRAPKRIQRRASNKVD